MAAFLFVCLRIVVLLARNLASETAQRRQREPRAGVLVAVKDACKVGAKLVDIANLGDDMIETCALLHPGGTLRCWRLCKPCTECS